MPCGCPKTISHGWLPDHARDANHFRKAAGFFSGRSRSPPWRVSAFAARCSRGDLFDRVYRGDSSGIYSSTAPTGRRRLLGISGPRPNLMTRSGRP